MSSFAMITYELVWAEKDPGDDTPLLDRSWSWIEMPDSGSCSCFGIEFLDVYVISSLA